MLWGRTFSLPPGFVPAWAGAGWKAGGSHEWLPTQSGQYCG